MHPIELLDVAVVDDAGFLYGDGLEGCFHVTGSDEVHSFRAKKREDRSEACMARLRLLNNSWATRIASHLEPPWLYAIYVTI